MLISCPECNAVYKISSDNIPDEGKKFKCAECSHIWLVKPEDLKNIEPEVENITENSDNSSEKNTVENKDNVTKSETEEVVKPQVSITSSVYDPSNPDIQSMFEKMSQDTKGLFSGAKSSESKKDIWRRKMQVFWSPMMLNGTLGVIALIFTTAVIYFNRFEIVDFIPRLEDFYNKLNIESIHNGKDIVFKDVAIRNINRKGQNFVEVYGLLYNESDMKSKIPPVRAILLNPDKSTAAESVKVLTLSTLDPQFSAVFRILIPNDTPLSKTVRLIFDTKINPDLITQ